MSQQTQGQIPAHIAKELDQYEEWIKQYRTRQIGEIKMQKIRLQLGTYAQRQEGVQMERVKFPGGVITSDQLVALAEASEKYASGFIHFTTREDAQLYFLKLEECPDMMRLLARAGITTREACGNTVRNITSCYRSGIAADEAFDCTPHAEALFRFLIRNKFNQVMGRKFKIAFESCAVDHAGMKFHDLGFQAVVKKEGGKEKRGFRTYIGGGLGGVPILGHLYTDFLPEEELLNLGAASLRLFDRYGERKNRMAARMKFLIKKMGWEAFKKALDEERKVVTLPKTANDYLKETHRVLKSPAFPKQLPQNPKGIESNSDYKGWVQDSSVTHKVKGYRGVNVRLKLGDLVADKAKKLAEIAKIFSQGTLRITIEQNLFLPWVPTTALPALFEALSQVGLASSGSETLEDTTTCPGADTCRLGITSAKGLGAGVSAALGNGLGRFKDLSRDVRVKVSGCPNGCAQHGVAQIGFQGAALKKDNQTVPAHEVFVGGQSKFDETRLGERIGKIPAKNGPKVVEAYMELYSKEKKGDESFSDCMTRLGKNRLQKVLAPFQEIPSFDEKPEFYEDWGHENEKFATRIGIKGECAGAPVQEKVPVMEQAKEKLNQAEAFLVHKEFANAQLEAYEAMAHAARIPLYAVFCDPFTSEQAIWEFENIFVRSGKASQDWLNSSEKLENEKTAKPSEVKAKELIQLAQQYIAECDRVHSSLK